MSTVTQLEALHERMRRKDWQLWLALEQNTASLLVGILMWQKHHPEDFPGVTVKTRPHYILNHPAKMVKL